MSDLNPTDPTEGVDTSVDTGTQETGGENPAWEPIRSQLDDVTWHRVKPELAKMDSSAQQRITQSNQSLAPYKEFIDNKVDPAQLRAAYDLANRLNSNPEEIYEQLGTFLQQNGRMPTKQEVATAAATGDELTPVDDPQQVDDSRFAQLEQQLDQQRQFIQQQAYQEEVRQADIALGNEQTALQDAHPDLTPADTREILSRAAFIAQQNAAQGINTIPSLEEVYSSWFTGLRNRFLTAPRPGDSAPQLLPTSGGLPSGQQQKTLGQLSNAEVQAMIASTIGGQ